ncbi:hypothetical protein AV530_011977 [Patagioenas fasciata monilis]|uniref:Uncharacterized protein n=1 Tax=Patagioenas fasciata monilis TaxID=372326 RepID=A0A1V4JUD7_PATFA|nr:hypothetical protein AV530_011977 [Patagioenas fasciata monilis]
MDLTLTLTWTLDTAELGYIWHWKWCSGISELAILFFVSAELPRELWHPPLSEQLCQRPDCGRFEAFKTCLANPWKTASFTSYLFELETRTEEQNQIQMAQKAKMPEETRMKKFIAVT